MRRLAVALALGATWLGCGTTSPDAGDASDEAGGPCSTNADCPSGSDCAYPIDGGCSASRRCIPKPLEACKGMHVCSCTEETLDACGAGASAPVRALGACIEGNCASGLACEECDVTGYAPLVLGSPVTSLGACTAQQLQDFVVACFGQGGLDQTTCDAWLAGDAGPCEACLAPALESSATWGPFVCPTSTSPCDENAGGCVDLVLGDVASETLQGGAGSCGDAVTLQRGCEQYACGTCNPADFPTCDQAALVAECASYVSRVDSPVGACAALATDASSPASICFPFDNSSYVAFANVFCGTGP